MIPSIQALILGLSGPQALDNYQRRLKNHRKAKDREVNNKPHNGGKEMARRIKQMERSK